MRYMSRKRQRQVSRSRRERTLELLYAAPWCARCCATNAPLAGHERRSRAQGGNPAQPDCLLCDTCNTWCEDNPTMAAWTGWKLSRKHPHDPKLRDDEAENLNGEIVVFGDVCEVRR